MPSHSFRRFLRKLHRKDGTEQLADDTDAGPKRNEEVRPQSARSTSTTPPVASQPSIAHERKRMNIIAQEPIQNSPQQSTTPITTIQLSLWEKARATLSDEDKEWVTLVGSDTSMSVHDMVSDMIDVASKGQQKWEATGTSQVKGQQISMSNAARKIIVWLNKFKEIGDIIVQYDPVHAALPWAVARFILMSIVASQEQQDASIAFVERATRIVHRCQVFEQLYNQKTVGSALAESLESALIELYSFVLQGLVEIHKILSKSRFGQSAHAIFHPTTGSDLLASLDKSEAQVDREVTACTGQRSDAAFTDIREKLCGLLDFGEGILRTDKNVKTMLEQINKDKLQEVLVWISDILYREHHDKILGSRTRDTCNWLVQHPEFSKWSTATSSATLWLQGLPGSGKTFLTSRIVEEVESTLVNTDNDEGFAFFYCNRTEDNRRNTLSILRSYIRQLSTTPRRSDSIYVELKQLYEESQLKGSGWTLRLCQKFLVKLLNLYPRTTLVLDALDECVPEEQLSLLDFFTSIPTNSPNPVRIFISSRPEGEIRQRLWVLPSIEIQATDNKKDMEAFVKQRIEQNLRWKALLEESDDVKKIIVDVLLAKSRGTFQYVVVNIGKLLELDGFQDIDHFLEDLPDSLNETYDVIWNDLMARRATAKNISLRALQWIMCAFRPLTSEELLAAVHVDPEVETIEPFYIKNVKIFEQDLMKWCAYFIELDGPHSSLWRVSHLSVVEYLETRRLPKAHCLVARASLVLLHETFGSEDERNHESGGIFHPDHGIQNYVRFHWMRHVQTQDTQTLDPKLVNLLKAFLGSLEVSSAHYRRWHNWLAENDSWPDSSGLEYGSDPVSPSTSTIFVACYFSFCTLLQDWWDAVPNVLLSLEAASGDDLLTLAAAGGSNALCMKLCEHGIQINRPLEDGNFGSALAAATCLGRTGIIQLLLDRGADVNLLLQTGYYGSALAAAAQTGRAKIVELLLDRGPNVNLLLQTGYYGSALAAAADTGTTTIVKLLLERGADVNLLLQTGEYGSALAAAAQTGRVKIVELLLDRGANANLLLQTGECGSALAAAAQTGRVKIVELLLDRGADVNLLLQTGEYGSALAAAAQTGRAKIVELLLDRGADVNLLLQAGEYGSDLAAAAQTGRVKIVELLLDRGANANLLLQTGEYGSALAAAAQTGRAKSVGLLLDRGADVNLLLQTGHFGSALAAAAALGGRAKIIELLLDRGADVNLLLQTGYFGSALAAAAAFGGRATIVKLLLDRGADVNLLLQTGYFGSALAAAASSGWTTIVKLLLERGADVNLLLQTGRYGSALAAAAAASSRITTTIVKLLLERGADVNLLLQTGEYGSALAAAAAFGGRATIVKLLLDRGADVNLLLQTGRYGSALAAAAAYDGDIDIVKLLLERGADVNLLLQTGEYGSALTAAAAYDGDIGIVKLLLERGADVNLLLQTGEYGSALAAAAAASSGITTIVKLLLERGADVNLLLQTGRYGSALAAAAAYDGDIDIVKLLLERGADVNLLLQTGDYGSALDAAAFWRRLGNVKLLVKHHMKTVACSEQGVYKSALEAAQRHWPPNAKDNARQHPRDANRIERDRSEVRHFLQLVIAGSSLDESSSP